MAKPGTITLPDDRFVELLVNAGRSLKAGGFKTDPLDWRVRRQPQRHAHGRRQAERAVEGQRREGVLDRRLLHEGPRRSEQVGHRKARHPRQPDRRPREHPRHLRAAVRQPEAHPPQSAERQRLRKQRRQRQQPVEVDARARQGVAADQDRQRARADQGADGRHVDAAGVGRAGRGRGRWARRRTWADAALRRPSGRSSSRRWIRRRQQDADRGARHGLHRRAHVGRNARRDEGRQDDRDRADRRHREERLPHGHRQT